MNILYLIIFKCRNDLRYEKLKRYAERKGLKIPEILSETDSDKTISDGEMDHSDAQTEGMETNQTEQNFVVIQNEFFIKNRAKLFDLVVELRGQVKNAKDEKPHHARRGSVFCPFDFCSRSDAFSSKGNFVIHCASSHPIETRSILDHEKNLVEEGELAKRKCFITEGKGVYEKYLAPNVAKFLKKYNCQTLDELRVPEWPDV